ncbi:hypothetical protein ACIG5E_06770 [Kitasatospora sp. NPDC053057]|uniref:hypothetical protein n=1 Tax=Kitasatospora sp. NPDC053057 TaxID=3364062 RepID=UPI0037C71F31
MTPDDAREDLYDRSALWAIGELRARDVVDAACAALVAGLDTPALRVLAACTYGEADTDVEGLLPPVMAELGLDLPELDTRESEEAGLRALARQLLNAELTPRELARTVHRRFGHRLELAEPLSCLDYEYDALEYGTRTREQLDAEARAEALRLGRGRHAQ